MSMADLEPARLEQLLHAGHWFLKHRSKGKMPHRRFVYVLDDTICWASKEDRTGKIGSMAVDEATLVVPGSATSVTASKKWLQDRRNRLFSIVGATRTLDLEVASDAERHLWVKAFGAFVRSRKDADGSAEPDLLALSTTDMLPGSRSPSESSGSTTSEVAVAARLVRHGKDELMGGVRFPQMRGALHVQLGDLGGCWQVWQLQLRDGELVAPELQLALSLHHVASARVAAVRGAAATAEGAAKELRLRIRPRGCVVPGGAPVPALKLPDLVLRGGAAQLDAWNRAIETSIGLLEDLRGSRGRDSDGGVLEKQLHPLSEEAVERELNRLFDGVFEHCAGAVAEAIASLDPLLSTCAAKLTAASTSLPPRGDVFAYMVEGMHRRFCNVYSVLLVRCACGPCRPPLIVIIRSSG